MKNPNFSSIYMDIHDDADLEKAFQTPIPESFSQVGESELKSIRELSKCFLFINPTPKQGFTTHPHPSPSNKTEL